jgi:hypothetical protein
MIVVFIVNRRLLIATNFSRISTFSIDLDFQLSSGKKAISGQIFIQSTGFSGDEQTTNQSPNTTPRIEFQPHPQAVHSPMTNQRVSTETVVDNHQIQFNLENLPRTWSQLEEYEQLPPIAIITEDPEEEEHY